MQNLVSWGDSGASQSLPKATNFVPRPPSASHHSASQCRTPHLTIHPAPRLADSQAGLLRRSGPHPGGGGGAANSLFLYFSLGPPPPYRPFFLKPQKELIFGFWGCNNGPKVEKGGSEKADWGKFWVKDQVFAQLAVLGAFFFAVSIFRYPVSDPVPARGPPCLSPANSYFPPSELNIPVTEQRIQGLSRGWDS